MKFRRSTVRYAKQNPYGPLGGESEVLYRPVNSKGPYGSCVQMKPVRAESSFEEVPYGVEFQRTVVVVYK